MALTQVEQVRPAPKQKKGRPDGSNLGATIGTIGGAIAGSFVPGAGTLAGAAAGASLGGTLGGMAGGALDKGQEAKSIERRMGAAPSLSGVSQSGGMSETTAELQKSIQALAMMDAEAKQKFGPALVQAYLKSADKDYMG